MNTHAGGNESPATVQFIEEYSRDVFPVVVVDPIIADMEGRAVKKRADMGFTDTDPLDFPTLAKLKGRFPSSRAQFCTYYLKIVPQKRWIAENLPDAEIIRYTGVRRDESARRHEQPISSWDEYFDCELRCPLADWTKQMCFDYVRAADEETNPLYKLGFNRVGCAPCINSSKDDILAWLDREPAMLDKIREWEEDAGRTFFAPMVPGKEINWIDEVIEWAKTEHGGKQYGLKVMYDRPTCESKYGLCE